MPVTKFYKNILHNPVTDNNNTIQNFPVLTVFLFLYQSFTNPIFSKKQTERWINSILGK